MNEKWKVIKKASEQLGSKLDTEKAWERFESRRKKDKKRPFALWDCLA